LREDIKVIARMKERNESPVKHSRFTISSLRGEPYSYRATEVILSMIAQRHWSFRTRSICKPVSWRMTFGGPTKSNEPVSSWILIRLALCVLFKLTQKRAAWFFM